MNFDEPELQKLFGHEAAEDEDPERLKEYYFKQKLYGQVVNDLPLRIVVGHKGVGKSALFQIAIGEEMAANRLTLLIKPDDVESIAQNSTNLLELIREWKKGINELIAKKALQSLGLQVQDWRGTLAQYGGEVLNFLVSLFGARWVDLTEANKLIINKFLSDKKISVYIDDLDRGWEGRESDIKRISALLNAIRDISRDNRGIFFRISLRSDVYFLSRTSDESTDKTEGSVIWYSWTNHEILALLVKRVESFFGNVTSEEDLLNRSQTNLMRSLSPVIETIFQGRGHWENAPMNRVLMSLVRKRPRDLVKLLTLAGREAHKKQAQIIRTPHLEEIFKNYSQDRLQDTINEYRSELPGIERLVPNMKPSKLQKKAAENYVYSTARLLKKIESIEEQGEFRWKNGKPATTRELAAFLYKINFLTARKEMPSGIERKYFEENRYLSNRFADFGYDWEVHPAYRWALQPETLNNIFDNLKLGID